MVLLQGLFQIRDVLFLWGEDGVGGVCSHHIL